MKREEKNVIMQKRIVDAALKEYAKNGYGASSINNICSDNNLSKGIIYHYFNSKDELYLKCVKDCFDKLTSYMKSMLSDFNGSIEDGLKQYFYTRVNFFKDNELYQRIFCEVVFFKSDHLQKEIDECRSGFDEFNRWYLDNLLKDASFCDDFSKEDVIETFRQYQDFINASYCFEDDFKVHETKCLKALNILLYGIIERK